MGGGTGSVLSSSSERERFGQEWVPSVNQHFGAGLVSQRSVASAHMQLLWRSKDFKAGARYI